MNEHLWFALTILLTNEKEQNDSYTEQPACISGESWCIEKKSVPEGYTVHDSILCEPSWNDKMVEQEIVLVGNKG